MITEAEFELFSRATVEELMDQLDDHGHILFVNMLNLVQTESPGMVHLAMALLFGSIAADAEKQGCPSDAGGKVDFAQRIRLFTIVAKRSYQESLEFVDALDLYGDGPTVTH